MIWKDVLILVSTGIASCTDLKSREIPLWLFPSAVVVFIAVSVFLKTPPNVFNYVGLAGTFVPFFITALMGVMGGGDLIMFSALGFILGAEELIPYGICMTAVATALFIIMKVRKQKQTEMPIAPIAFVSYAGYLMWKTITGGL